MKAFCFLSVFALISVGKASAGGTFVPRSAITTNENGSILKIRGGAVNRKAPVKKTPAKNRKNQQVEESKSLSPFPKESVCKFATILFGLNAGYMMLAPAKALEKYGFSHTPLMEYMVEWFGHIAMSQAIASFCLYFKNTSVKTAIGSGTLWLLVSTIKSLLNELPEQFGFSTKGQYTFLVINAFCSWSLLTDNNNADRVLIGYPVWGLLNSAMFFFAPEDIGAQWGVDGTNELTYALKNIGLVLASKSFFFALLGLGEERTRAFGYGILPSLFGLLSNTVITKEVTTLDLPQNLTNAWILVMTIFAVFLLL